jgi:hypothetical protein
MKRLCLVIALLVPYTLTGCGGGDGLPREQVSGLVTLAGEPLESGLIQFEPTDPSIPTLTGGEITEGRYLVPRVEGPVPGTYRVIITSNPKEAELDPEEGELPGMVPIAKTPGLPARYNSQTELKAEVTAGGPNTFDFSLEP